MKLVLAFDSFKGSLSAAEACWVAAEAVRVAWPTAEIVVRPLADGGEGTVDALVAALGGERLTAQARDPAGRSVQGAYGWCPVERLALVEMAEASGLTRMAAAERNPLTACSYGTGQILAAACARDPERILLGLGGSATVDGGTGAARALGWIFLDAQGRVLPPGGGALIDLKAIHPPEVWRLPPVELLCDVTNPLLGASGAARVFGPQKGATPAMVEQLEAGLVQLAEVTRRSLGVELGGLSGGGAAGGMGAGATVWFRAAMASGIERVLDAMAFDEACRDADWVLTGEGSFDEQSLQGKVVAGVMARVRRVNPAARVAVLAGRLGLSSDAWKAAGIAWASAISPVAMPIDEACTRAPALLRAAVHEFCRDHPSR